MAPMQRYAKRQANPLKRRRLKARERIRPQRAEAQRDIEALHQAREDLGFPDTLVAEIEGRWQAQPPLLGQIVGLLFPPLLGARHPQELTRVRGGEKHVPSTLLGACPQKSWRKRLRRWGLERLLGLWRHTHTPSASPHSRWPWRWGADDAGCRPYGRHFRLVGRWGRGQCKRPVFGIDGGVGLGVIGEGKRISPVDFALRRPQPQGPGRQCQDKLPLPQHRLDDRWAALANRGGPFPPPMVVADSGCRASKRMRQVADAPQGTLLVPGKSPSPFTLEDGPKVNGSDWVPTERWAGPSSRQAPGGRSVRRRARSRTSGQGVLVVVDKPGAKPFSLIAMSLAIAVTRLMPAWKQRPWIEPLVRILKHL